MGSEESYQSDLSTGCRNYHFCSKDGLKLITLTCSDEKIFDGKKCVDPTRYRCPMIEDGVAKSDELEAYYAYSPLNREIDSQGINIYLKLLIILLHFKICIYH